MIDNQRTQRISIIQDYANYETLDWFNTLVDQEKNNNKEDN